jgi:glycerate 2-kinase
MPTLVAAPDKFRGTATARQVAGAVASAAARRGWSALELPLSDGGEGFLDVLERLGGQRETLVVEGPLGVPVEAEWLHLDDVAVIEMARASGLALVGGAEGNDALRAGTRGTGQLIVAAARWLRSGTHGTGGNRLGGAPVRAEGATAGTVLVGLGGSATSDGGRGAVSVIEQAGGLAGIELVGACDVDVPFFDAAVRFGPQKGASEAEVVAIEARLHEVARAYESEFGVDVRSVPGSGAAGGLGGAIVALGGRLRSGFDLVAELTGFHEVLRSGQLVVTGEGSFDATSLAGKVVGSVLTGASELGIPSLVVAGRATPEACRAAERLGADVVSLSRLFGESRALSDALRCVDEAVTAHLGERIGIAES